MRFAVLVALLAASSCGRWDFGERDAGGDGGSTDGDGANIPSFSPTWTSGTRYRARLLVVGDGGDPIFIGWRDTQLDTDCQSATAADGVERCVPENTRADQYYADAACTQRLAWVHPAQCGHDSYAFFPDTSGNIHELPIGAPYSGAVYTAGPCTAASAPSVGMLYNTGAEVPASSFAPTHYSMKLVGKYVHELRGYSDGAIEDMQTLAFNSGPCKPTGGVASGTTGCLPTSDPVLVPVYLDAGCTQRAFYSASGAVPSPEFVVDETTACGVGYSLWNVVVQSAAAQYWTLGPGPTCAMQTTGTGTLFAAAPAPDPYPTGTVAPGPRRGRIGMLYWTADDGVPIPLAYWDQDLQRSCYYFTAADGVLRCLPRRAKPVTAYPDGACATATATLAASCYNGLDPVGGPSYASCTDGPWTVHTLPALAASSYYAEATCTSLGPAFDPSGNTGTLPATMFVQLVEMIE